MDVQERSEDMAGTVEDQATEVVTTDEFLTAALNSVIHDLDSVKEVSVVEVINLAVIDMGTLTNFSMVGLSPNTVFRLCKLVKPDGSYLLGVGIKMMRTIRLFVITGAQALVCIDHYDKDRSLKPYRLKLEFYLSAIPSEEEVGVVIPRFLR